jgi:hypothetical protein
MENAYAILKLKRRRETFLNVIVLVMLLALLGYLGYQIVPVYAAQGAFQEGLLDLARDSTLRQWNDQTIAQQVVQLGQARQFSVQEENIRIQRFQDNPQVGIVVDYTKTGEFPGGYIYVFYFRSEVQALL